MNNTQGEREGRGGDRMCEQRIHEQQFRMGDVWMGVNALAYTNE